MTTTRNTAIEDAARERSAFNEWCDLCFPRGRKPEFRSDLFIAWKAGRRIVRLSPASERAEVVAWLREEADRHNDLASEFRSSNIDQAKAHKSISHSYNTAADAIERGEHLRTAPSAGEGETK